MERIYQYFFHRREARLKARYERNLITYSNCLNTTAQLTDAKPRVLAGNNLEQRKSSLLETVSFNN